MKKSVFYILFLLFFTPLLNVSCFALKFSKNEKEIIDKKIYKCIATSTWEPINFIVNDKIEGLGIDYWNLVKEKIGIKSKCIVVKNFEEVLNQIKYKKSDINIATDKTEDREKFAYFSKPYDSFPIVIATRNDVGFISNIELLKDKKIAVGKNYTAAKILQKEYPNFHIIEAKNIDEALKLVSDGIAYAAIDILPVISYKINKYAYVNLKISGKTPWLFKTRFMINKEHKELIPILNKAIDDITSDEREKIYKKWVSVIYETPFNKNLMIIIFILFLVVLIISFGWILYLKKEINKRKKLEIELEKLATIDKLTSIYNRYKTDLSLKEQIEIAKRYNRPLSIIFLDIDHFKNINDKFGHKKGDTVLKELALFVKKHLRKSDIFGRWGGEEFLIILPETNKSEAVKLAEKLRESIENGFIIKGIDRFTCSFGVSEYRDGDTLESLIQKVDKKLYKAKQSGRNRVVYY